MVQKTNALNLHSFSLPDHRRQRRAAGHPGAGVERASPGLQGEGRAREAGAQDQGPHLHLQLLRERRRIQGGEQLQFSHTIPQ